MLSMLVAHVAHASTTTVQRVSREIEALVRDRADASQKGDVTRWRRRVADDCAWIGVGLAVATTADVATAQVGYVGRVDVEDFNARVFGDTVVATYLLLQRIGTGADERVVRLRKLDTYARRKGYWWLVANAESLAPPPRTVVAIDPATLDRYAGEYAGTFAQKPVRVRLWREGTALMAQDSTSATPFELKPTSDVSFFAEGEPADWIVELDTNGRARAVLYRAGGVDMRFERVVGANPR
jgi:ketosteroid isomerase-like protein